LVGFPSLLMTSSSLLGIDYTRFLRYWLSSIFRTHSLVTSSFYSFRLVALDSLSCTFIRTRHSRWD
jgi:hypothetical protein